MKKPPIFLFVDTNKCCNLRCQHCLYWMTDDKDQANFISMSRRNEIINEFAEMNLHGTVVVCGGESMLDLDKFFSVT